MSLATTMQDQGARPVSFLPSIKCSTCAQEIEIARMGDHICGAPPTPVEPSPPKRREPVQLAPPPASEPSPKIDQVFNASAAFLPPTAQPLYRPQPPPSPAQGPRQTRSRAPTVSSQTGTSRKSSPKSTRAVPPNINPEVANKPFLAPTQSPKRTDSPFSPPFSATSSDGGKPALLRTQTSPLENGSDRPPSHQLSKNLESPFPRLEPPGRETRPSNSKEQGMGIGHGRAASRGGARQEGRLKADDGKYDLAPRSPSGTSGHNVMQRMNTLREGPFQGGRRKPSRDERPPMPPPAMRQASDDATAVSVGTGQPQSSTASNNAATSVKQAPSRPARPAEDVLSPSFLSNLNAEPVQLLPSTSYSSAAPIRPHHDHLKRDGEEVRNDPRQLDAPLVPKPVQQYREESRHSPSASGSSTVSSSGLSVSNSNSTSGPSPISSAASSVDALTPIQQDPSLCRQDDKMRVQGLNVRNPIKPGQRAEAGQGQQRSPPRNFTRPPPPRAATDEPKPSGTAHSDAAGPARSATSAGRKPGRGPQWAPRQGDPRGPPPRSNTAPSDNTRTPSPMQASPPHQQANQLYQSPEQQPAESGLQLLPNQTYAPQQQQQRYNSSTHSQGPPTASQNYHPSPSGPPPRSRSPLPPHTTASPPPIHSSSTQPPHPLNGSRRPHTPATRPICRGCKHTIEGKSIKAADGRLTGRWHKACFVCRTCASPFSTTSFYVHHDQPYCEQHYHEINGSLCNGCARGIEGEYLETSSSSSSLGGPGGGEGEKKFHPRCFVCSDPGCREVLREEYFEITGRVFCERHALAAMRGMVRTGGGRGGRGLQPSGNGGVEVESGDGGGLDAQGPGHKELMAGRRTTRLMVM
ncbi:hypothetical protein MBLNU230_g0675t1 [Neophaeotheca triangularis]